VSHLAEARNESDLHRLMRLEWRESLGGDSGGVVQNAWFTAQSRRGDLLTYAQDVERAWSLAVDASLAEARSGDGGSSVGLEVRYALLASSLRARAHNIRPPLAVALVQTGLWTVERGLAYARQLPRAARRVQALNGLATLAPSPQRIFLLREALAEARGVGGEVVWQREFTPPPADPGQAVAVLAPSLPESLFDDALDIALAADDFERADALVALAPHLPRALVDRTLAAVRMIDPVLQALPLAALASRLSGPERVAFVEEAFRRWIGMDQHDSSRTRLLQLLAPHLHEANYPPRLLVEDLLRLGSLPEIAVAVSLARNGPEAEGRELLEEAQAALERRAMEELEAVRLKRDDDQVQFIAELAGLAAQLPESVLRGALSLAVELPDEWKRHQAVRALAPVLPRQLALEALHHAQAMSRAETRAVCLAALVPSLPDADRMPALDQLLQDIPGIPPEELFGTRADVLAAAASHLTPQQLVIALRLAETIADGDLRAEALGTIGRHLPPAERRATFDDALIAARGHAGPWALAGMLAAFGSLPYGASSVALTAAREQEDPGARAVALAHVVPSLDEPERGQVLTEALLEAQASGPMTVVMAFAPIAGELPEGVFVAVLDALATDDADRRYLEAFAPHIPDDLLPRALEVARAESSPFVRAEALVVLAPRIDAARNDALVAVLALNESNWPEYLRRLAPHLPRELLEQAWQAARELSGQSFSRFGRARSLAALAPHFAEPRRRSVLQEAIEAAVSLGLPEGEEILLELERSFRGRGWSEALALAKLPYASGVPDVKSRIKEAVGRLRDRRRPSDLRQSAARELLELAPHLPPPLLAEALDSVCSSVEVGGGFKRDDRVWLLARVAETLATLAPDDLAPIWSRALHRLGSTGTQRRWLLAEIQALVPALAALGGPAGLREAAHAIRDVGMWLP
jgi:hypothetical protein